MSCSKCGAATQVIESNGGVEQGHFVEKHECANGHMGTVEGLAQHHPDRWHTYGAVFEE